MRASDAQTGPSFELDVAGVVLAAQRELIVLDEPETVHEERLAPLWKVICHDDPITTMDFVVDMLSKIFRLPLAQSMELMLRVHMDGSAVIGLWPESVARKKVNLAHAMARADQFPLTLSIEKDS